MASTWDSVTVEGATMKLYPSLHAFMNRRGARYHAQADRDSWPKALAFFDAHLGRVAAASTR